MRKKLTILVALLVLLTTGMAISYAAFPVAATSNQTTTSLTAGNETLSTPVMSQANDNAPMHKEAPAAPGKSGKSQIVAAILCFFLGGLGIHRFYLGYTWQGIVQLLTGGGCGIWALIDFIRILTGDLGPKDGSYAKTL